MEEDIQGQLTKFFQLSRALSQATSFTHASEIFLTLGSSLVGAQAAAVWTNEVDASLKPLTYIGKTEHDIAIFTSALNNSQTALSHLLSSQHVSFVEDLSFLKDVPELYSFLENTAKASIIMTIPKKGYLFFFFSNSKKFSSFTKDIVVNLADQFLHVMQKRPHEFSKISKYDDVVRKIVGLQRITSLLSYASTKEKVGEIMVKEGFEMMGAEVGEVALFNPKKNVYDIIVQIGYPKELVDTWPTTYRVEDSFLTNVVIQGKQPLFITDVNSVDKKFKIMREIMHTTGLSSLSLLPLKIKEKILGSINFYFRIPQSFTDFDKQILLMLAGQCAQALDRVISREELNKSKLDLERILLKVGEGVVIRDVAGEVLYMNKEAKRLYTLSEKNPDVALDEEGIPSITDEEGKTIDFAQFHYKDMLQKPAVYEKDFCLTWHNGVVQWLRVKSFPTFYKKNLQNIVEIVQDISDLKEKEQIKEEFISIASHELKTPLTSLTLYLHAMERFLKNKEYEDTSHILGRAIDQTNRLSLLVRDMLDITKMKYGKENVRKRKIFLEDLVRDTVAEMQQVTRTHTIQIKGTSTGMILGDKEKIRQVLINLISNAIKYSPEATSIEVTLSQNKSGIKVCVYDYGIGIGKEDLGSIFKPFVRAENHQKLRIPGMGLGLYISAEIIKSHKGQLWGKRDKQKEQTSFCFLLPTLE